MRRVVELDELRQIAAALPAVTPALEHPAQRTQMPTWLRPQAAVVERRVLDGEPEARHRDRIGVEERRVLVAPDLATDVRLLEDVHALQRERVGQTQVGSDLGQFSVCS